MTDANSSGHRWGAGLRKIGRHLIEQLGVDNTNYNNGNSSRNYSCCYDNHQIDTTSTTIAAAAAATTPSPGQQQQQLAPPPVSPLPLGRIPDDACLNVFSFLTAIELSNIRRVSSDTLETADDHARVLWERLCRCDFPSLSPPALLGLPPHQQYVKNVLQRANEETANLRATQRLRESLERYSSSSSSSSSPSTSSPSSSLSSSSPSSTSTSSSWSSNNKSNKLGGKSGRGVIGLVSDLGTILDPRVARAVSHKRRAAMSTVVVTDVDVVYDFRRAGCHMGPVNFLPVRTLQLEYPAPVANWVVAGGEGEEQEEGEERRGRTPLLPAAPELPPPTGFLGYTVRLVRLRPEHEPLRWTVLFALFKDMAVFETVEQAEAVRARRPDGRLFYCALDYPGAQDEPSCLPGGRGALPHISHWGFRPMLCGINGGGGGSGGEAAGAVSGEGGGIYPQELVGDAVERQERTACFARSSLAFLQYGGRVARHVQ